VNALGTPGGTPGATAGRMASAPTPPEGSPEVNALRCTRRHPWAECGKGCQRCTAPEGSPGLSTRGTPGGTPGPSAGRGDGGIGGASGGPPPEGSPEGKHRGTPVHQRRIRGITGVHLGQTVKQSAAVCRPHWGSPGVSTRATPGRTPRAKGKQGVRQTQSQGQVPRERRRGVRGGEGRRQRKRRKGCKAEGEREGEGGGGGEGGREGEGGRGRGRRVASEGVLGVVRGGGCAAPGTPQGRAACCQAGSLSHSRAQHVWPEGGGWRGRREGRVMRVVWRGGGAPLEALRQVQDRGLCVRAALPCVPVRAAQYLYTD